MYVLITQQDSIFRNSKSELALRVVYLQITLSQGSLANLESLANRSKYSEDPLLWVAKRTRDYLWSKQREILLSVKHNRRTAVPSCHSSGKSFVTSRIIAHWIESHPPGEAFAITSAPTGRQVKAILWREMSKVHAYGLIGRLNQTEWWLDVKGPDGNIHEEMVAFGQKPANLDPTSFQGIHAKYVLVVFDEACGMAEMLGDAADTLISNEYSRFLAIGNPDDPTSWFADICKPGSGWNVIPISAFDTPAFTEEEVPTRLTDNLISQLWVREKVDKWVGKYCSNCGKLWNDEDKISFRSLEPKCSQCGEVVKLSPIYISKILGQFPDHSEDNLIPLSWIVAAQQRTLQPGLPNCLGVDVGGGGDKSVVAHRLGPWVRIIRRDTNPDTMATCGNVLHDLNHTGATEAKIDKIGIGRGVVDRGRELKRNGKTNKRFIGINVGEQARQKDEFTRLRSEAWWALRERFREGTIDIDHNDEDLAGQLANIKYKRTSDGRIQVETKEEMKKRGLGSPDEADAVVLAFIEPVRVKHASHSRKRRKK